MHLVNTISGVTQFIQKQMPKGMTYNSQG